MNTDAIRETIGQLYRDDVIANYHVQPDDTTATLADTIRNLAR